jgi:hypothetical protein
MTDVSGCLRSQAFALHLTPTLTHCAYARQVACATGENSNEISEKYVSYKARNRLDGVL